MLKAGHYRSAMQYFYAARSKAKEDGVKEHWIFHPACTGVCNGVAPPHLDTVDVSDEEMQRRREAWVMPPFKYTRGTMMRYIRTVASAQKGCVTDE